VTPEPNEILCPDLGLLRVVSHPEDPHFATESMQSISRILSNFPRTCGWLIFCLFCAAEQRVIGKMWLRKWELKQPNVSHSRVKIQFESLLCADHFAGHRGIR